MKHNPYDQEDYTAFVLNGSRISTDDREQDEMDEFDINFVLSSYDDDETREPV
jgi:hypothetical protein